MCKWGIELSGPNSELQSSRDSFGGVAYSTHIRSVTIDDGTSETALIFVPGEGHETVNEIASFGSHLCDVLNGIRFIQNPKRTPFSGRALLRSATFRPTNAQVFSREVSFTSKAKIGLLFPQGAAQFNVDKPAAITLSTEQKWLLASIDGEPLAEALSYLAKEPNWFDIWKVYEIMRRDIKTRTEHDSKESTNPWPSKPHMTRFEQSVNKNRHSSAKVIPQPREGWMDLTSCQILLVDLFRGWMEWRSNGPMKSN
jgi:hypothetical protein